MYGDHRDLNVLTPPFPTRRLFRSLGSRLPKLPGTTLHARTRAEGDFHAPVLRLANAIGGLDQRAALAERFGGHDAFRHTATGQIGANRVGTTLRQTNVVVRDRKSTRLNSSH